MRISDNELYNNSLISFLDNSPWSRNAVMTRDSHALSVNPLCLEYSIFFPAACARRLARKLAATPQRLARRLVRKLARLLPRHPQRPKLPLNNQLSASKQKVQREAGLFLCYSRYDIIISRKNIDYVQSLVRKSNRDTIATKQYLSSS